MRSLFDSYGLPDRLPGVLRIVILMLAIPVGGAIAIFLILPHTPVVMLVVVLWVLATGAAGLWLVAAAREPNPPEPHPEPPPSPS